MKQSDTKQDAIATPTPKPPSLVPMGVTIGLAVFALALASLGFGFRLLGGETVADVVRHALAIVAFFLIVLPSGFVAGAKLLNRIEGSHIATRNAFTLGLLISVVALLTIMGRYS